MSMTVCIGPSMIPTMKQDGDVVITQSFTHRVLGRPYQTGEVVICQCPYDPTKTVCKRIVAIEGDVIDPQGDTHHRHQDWSFWKVADHNAGGRFSDKMVIPPGHVWLRGDNSKNSRLASVSYFFFVLIHTILIVNYSCILVASMSRDSRNYGPVPSQLLRGQVICKIFSMFLKPVEPVLSKLPSYDNDDKKA